MGGQVRLVHVTVLGDWLAACLAARFASVAVPARGVGVALGSGGGRACGVSGLWPVGCARLGAPGRVIGRVSGCVSVGGCVSGRGRGLAPGGVARASVGGLLFAFARVAGRA